MYLGKLFQCLRVSYKCSSNIKCQLLDLVGKKQKMKRNLSLCHLDYDLVVALFSLSEVSQAKCRNSIFMYVWEWDELLLKCGHLNCRYQLGMKMKQTCQWVFPAYVF